MPTLQNFDGASLVTRPADSISAGLDLGQKLQSSLLTPGLMERLQQGDETALGDLARINPQAANNFQILQDRRRQARMEAATEAVTNERIKMLKLRDNIQSVLKDGPDGIRNNVALLARQREGDPDFVVQEAIDIANMAVTDPEGAQAQLERNLEQVNRRIRLTEDILKPLKSQPIRVQSSDVLPDGTTVQVMTDGSTRVTDPQGRELTGTARSSAIREAQEFGIDVQTRRSAGRTAGSEGSKRDAALIERGVAAAESTATVRRALTLLDRVETGGPEAISLSIKQRLGIEGADEGELSNSLGKAVLSQLRETFGAAFTENEGQRLERIEANFGKSVATNRRLLQQALRIAENTARRAAKKARDLDRTAEAEDIEQLLEFNLDIDEGTAEEAAAGNQVGRFIVEEE